MKSIADVMIDNIEKSEPLSNISNVLIYRQIERPGIFSPEIVPGIVCEVTTRNNRSFTKQVEFSESLENYRLAAQASKELWSFFNTNVWLYFNIFRSIEATEKTNYEEPIFHRLPETQHIIRGFPENVEWLQVQDGFYEETGEDSFWPYRGIGCEGYGSMYDGRGAIFVVSRKTKKAEQVKEELREYCEFTGARFGSPFT